jgi:2-methylcitrate dehydratase PrpD
MDKPLARRLAEWVVDLAYPDLPADVIEKAKVCLLHGIGLGLAGHPEPVSQPALDLVRSSEALPTGAGVIGTPIRATAAGAALANSVLMHARLQEDAYRTASHPGSAIIPAALAIGELTGATGRDLLVALVAGYEVMAAAIGETIPHTTPRGFRATPLYGGLGAAAAVGKLLDLDVDRLTSALGFAATLTGGTTGSMSGGMSVMVTQNAWAARNGLLSAQVAAAGGQAGEEALEGKGGFYAAFAGLDRAPNITAHLGREWRIHEVTLKRYPAAMFNQPIIHLALQLATTHDLRPEAIEGVQVQLADFEIRYPSNEFKERLELLASPALVTALALADRRGPTGPNPRLDPPSPAARALLPRITLAPGRPGLSPGLIVTTHGGAVYQAETHDAADFRFGFDEDAAIVRSLQPVMPIDPARLDRLIEDCARLETLPTIGSLLSHTTTA